MSNYKRSINFRLRSSLSELESLRCIIEGFGQDYGLPRKIVFQLNLVLEELFTNVIKYGYEDEEEHLVSISIHCWQGVVTIEVEDDAMPFNPLSLPVRVLHHSNAGREPGGLGIHLIRNLIDKIEYERRQGKNFLRIVKRV